MKFLLSFLLILGCMTLMHANQQQIDELGIEAELAIEEQNWSEADRVLTKLKSIGADLGIKERYTHLKIMEQLEQYGRILEEIDGVIASIDRESKLYKPLLKLKILSKKNKGKQDIIVAKKQEAKRQEEQRAVELKQKQSELLEKENARKKIVDGLVNNKSNLVIINNSGVTFKVELSSGGHFISKPFTHWQLPVLAIPVTIKSYWLNDGTVAVHHSWEKNEYHYAFARSVIPQKNKSHYFNLRFREIQDAGQNSLGKSSMIKLNEPDYFVEEQLKIVNNMKLKFINHAYALVDENKYNDLQGKSEISILHPTMWIADEYRISVNGIDYGLLKKGSYKKFIIPLNSEVYLRAIDSHTRQRLSGFEKDQVYKATYNPTAEKNKLTWGSDTFNRWARKCKDMGVVKVIDNELKHYVLR